MTEPKFGPVEFYLVGLDSDTPSTGVVEALTQLIESETVRLLDFVVVAKAEDGTITISEIEDHPDQHGLGHIELGASGITGDADIEEFAPLVAPGTAAALVALELSWARNLTRAVSAAGAEVLAVERVPAPIVNALVDAVAGEE